MNFCSRVFSRSGTLNRMLCESSAYKRNGVLVTSIKGVEKKGVSSAEHINVE